MSTGKKLDTWSTWQQLNQGGELATRLRRGVARQLQATMLAAGRQFTFDLRVQSGAELVAKEGGEEYGEGAVKVEGRCSAYGIEVDTAGKEIATPVHFVMIYDRQKPSRLLTMIITRKGDEEAFFAWSFNGLNDLNH